MVEESYKIVEQKEGMVRMCVWSRRKANLSGMCWKDVKSNCAVLERPIRRPLQPDRVQNGNGVFNLQFVEEAG